MEREKKECRTCSHGVHVGHDVSSEATHGSRPGGSKAKGGGFSVSVAAMHANQGCGLWATYGKGPDGSSPRA